MTHTKACLCVAFDRFRLNVSSSRLNRKLTVFVNIICKHFDYILRYLGEIISFQLSACHQSSGVRRRHVANPITKPILITTRTECRRLRSEQSAKTVFGFSFPFNGDVKLTRTKGRPAACYFDFFDRKSIIRNT